LLHKDNAGTTTYDATTFSNPPPPKKNKIILSRRAVKICRKFRTECKFTWQLGSKFWKTDTPVSAPVVSPYFLSIVLSVASQIWGRGGGFVSPRKMRAEKLTIRITTMLLCECTRTTKIGRTIIVLNTVQHWMFLILKSSGM
jgi:hypothetical protein